MTLQVFDEKIICLPIQPKPTTAVHWYVVNKGTIDVHKLIASLGCLSKNGMGTWEMPPMSWLCTHGCVMERAFFY